MVVVCKRAAVLALAVLAMGAPVAAGRAGADSGLPSDLVARYAHQRVEAESVAFCPGRGSLAACYTAALPFTFTHSLLLDDGGRRLQLRSAQLARAPTGVVMDDLNGRQLGRRLRVVALDRRQRVQGESYVGHRLWRIELPRPLPERLYMITGEFAYPGGSFWDFAFGASSDD